MNDLPEESVEIEDQVPPEVIDQGDGTSTVTLDDQSGATPEHAFTDNLAEVLDEGVLDGLAEKYLSLIDQDVESRKPRDKQYTDGLKRTGIAEPAPGGASFEGASRATHPVLAESYVDFAASSIKELFPPNGPVRSKIEGKPNRQKIDKATRKTAFMNWQLTNQIKEYRSELEKLLTQLPAGGTQFFKIFWSEDKKRIAAEFVPIDDFILPYNAKNFFDCQRKFDRMALSPMVLERRIESGQYRDWSLPKAFGMNMTETDASKQTAKIEGKTDDHSGEDNDSNVYEGVIYDKITGDETAPDDRAVPYLITIDEENRKILGLYRDWKEGDAEFQELDHTVDYNFIPWRGALGIGLPQLIGGLSDALTGSLRALLDAALIASSATALKLKGTPSGNNNSIEMTQVTEIDALGADDIRKIAMPLPFPGPSPVLFQLLGFLDAAAKGVVSTSEEKIADASNNMPVGTALALIEQGAKVFSAIHARLHDSQRRVLEIIHRLNAEHLPDRVQFGSDPEDYVTRQDFEGPMDVHPVSDPNIFSETQRFAQTQAIMQMITQLAPVAPQVLQMNNLHALFKRAYQQMKIPDYEEILADIPTPIPTNPVDENIDLALGKPVKAFEGQDHQAHIQVHLDFGQSPFFGQSPAMSPSYMANALNHIQDHLLVMYGELMKQDSGTKPGVDSPDQAEAMAKSSAVVGQAMQVAFEKIPQIMQQAAQMIQAKAPKPPVDPSVQIMSQKVQGDQQLAHGKLSLAAQKQKDDAGLAMKKLQQDFDKMQKDYELAMAKIDTQQETDLHDTAVDAHTKLLQTGMDNRSAETIAAAEIAHGHDSRLSTGGSIDGPGGG